MFEMTILWKILGCNRKENKYVMNDETEVEHNRLIQQHKLRYSEHVTRMQHEHRR